MKNRLAAQILSLLLPAARLFALAFPKQSNCFAFAISKPDGPKDLHPWMVLRENKVGLNHDWVKKRYVIGSS